MTGAMGCELMAASRLSLLLRRGPPGQRGFSVTVKMDLKIAAVITAVGLGVPGGLAVAGVGPATAPVGLR
jgi:hypothetical protein